MLVNTAADSQRTSVTLRRPRQVMVVRANLTERRLFNLVDLESRNRN